LDFLGIASTFINMFSAKIGDHLKNYPILKEGPAMRKMIFALALTPLAGLVHARRSLFI